MIKKTFCLILVSLFISLSIFAFDNDLGYRIKSIAGSSEIIKYGDDVGIRIGNKYEIKSISDYYLSDNGWYSVSYCGKKIIPIFGGGYFIFYSDEENVIDFFPRTNDFDTFVKQNIHPTLSSPDDLNKEFFGGVVPKVKSITVSNYLTETINGKSIAYDTYDMTHFYSVEPETGISVFKLNAKPWASSQNPIGQTFKLMFSSKQKVIVILNGYVDPQKQHLYKANRRLKTIKISSKEDCVSITKEIEDVVHFEQIVLPKACSECVIEIVDFYEGTKYKDICIQFIGGDEVFFESYYSEHIDLEKKISYNGHFKKYTE